ncbi:galactose-1-phosphate uridylyltransferase [Qipengyuania nanhaisediminis]
MLRLYGRTPHSEPARGEEADDIAQGGELRYHPLRREWNVYAAHRQNRTFKPRLSEDPLAPTLPGRPATEIPFTDFECAVFDNRFAAFHPEADDAAALAGLESEPARGACDVLVYSPEPEGSLATVTPDRRQVVLAAILDRYSAHFDAGRHYVLPFENRGDEVGVTLHHPHGQIYAMDRVPRVQRDAIAAFADGYDLAREIERALPEYGLGSRGGITAFVPRFARFPFEVWICPLERRAGPWECDAEELESLAYWLGEVTRRYDALFARPAATMMAIHAAPNPAIEAARGFHFTVQFAPLLRAADRVKYLAAVEQHSGVFTVDVMPEAAAAALRSVGQP